MGIRIVTVERILKRNGLVYRVRWRVTRKVGDQWIADRDGVEGQPDTWAAAEVEYFVNAVEARAAAVNEREVVKGLRPAGVVDSVKAHVLWATLTDEEREHFHRGVYRKVPIRAEVGVAPETAEVPAEVDLSWMSAAERESYERIIAKAGKT